MIDAIDRRILSMLQKDARVPNAEIARQVELAPSAIFQRIKKLEQAGIIRGYTARISPKPLGFGLLAFVQIRTAPGATAPEVTRELTAIPEVFEVHRVVGEDCFYLKVRVSDPEALEELLDQKIQPLGSVASTRTTIVLSTSKESQSLPLEATGQERDGRSVRLEAS
jgi:Lrp/AsnC family transcriptional regulator, leucine-responsive regulatory protein